MKAFGGHSNKPNKYSSEAGSALIYILIAIALLAALTVSFMEPSSQQTSAQGSFRTVSDLRSQVQMIQSSIQECVLLYNKGDPSIAAGTDPAQNAPFPIKPSSTHFNGMTPGPTAGNLVRDIRCPGNPDTSQKDHTLIFAASEGKFMPPTPDLFTDWQYYNAVDGVFFWTETSNSDAFLTSALAKLDGNYSNCETDVIDATGAAVDLDVAGTIECPSGSTCFRFWVVYNDATSHQDAGCP